MKKKILLLLTFFLLPFMVDSEVCKSDGIIERKVYPEVPPKVEYYLTDKGNDLRPIIDLMKEYGLKYKGSNNE